MLSEQDKQAILNGAYGKTRNGEKVRFIASSNHDDLELAFIIMFKDKVNYYCPTESSLFLFVNKDSFKAISSTMEDHKHDIVGLWEESNEVEPFNLERALSGEPVLLQNHKKAFILKQINDNLIGYFDESTPARWDIDGTFDRAADSVFDIIGMWQEPKYHTVTLTLPCPLKKLSIGQTFFRFTSLGNIVDEPYSELLHQKLALEKGTCFNTREEAKAWLEAMKDNRR